MRVIKKVIALMMILLMASGLFAGCGTAESVDGDSTNGKTMVIGDTTFNSENWEESVDPHTTYNGWACIRYGIGETLVHYSDAMELEPWLAKSWENDGNLTWTITLKDGIIFSNGRLLDAEAVKQCFEHMLANHDRAAYDTKIDSMTAEGQVLTITTTEPNPALMNYLGDPYSCIIDCDASDFDNGIVIGTGPYVVTDLVTDDHLTLTKNDNYWDGTPHIDTLIIRTISDGDTLSAALQAGDIDAAYGLSYESYPLFENENYQFSSVDTSRVFFATVNMKSDIMQEDVVREAIAMGIDKASFVAALLDGHGKVATGPFPEGLSDFGGENVTAPEYNPAAAAAILEKAGWVDTDGDGIREKNGTKLTLRWLTYPSRQELPLLAEAAQASLKEIGINVEINCTANRRDYLADETGWDIYASAMVTSPSGDGTYFFTSCCDPLSSYNFGQYENTRVTELTSAMATEFDVDKRSKLAIEASQAIVDDHAYIFVSFLQMSMVSKSNVTGYSAHACDYYQVTAKLDIE